MKMIPVMLVLGFGACSTFTPIVDESRFFVLSDAPCAHGGTVSSGIGIARVLVPEYLKAKAIAVRSGNSEIKLSDRLFWAERMDSGIQRAIARDMSLTPAHLTAWKQENVSLEVYVTIYRFDLDESGRGVLQAQYRIARKSGADEVRVIEFSRQGPRLSANPPAAVQTLSALIGDLSCELLERCRTLER